MNRTLVRRSLLILATVLASAFVIVRSPVHPGLDLRGGASLMAKFCNRVGTKLSSPHV
jgi:hypothetical protein